MAEPIRIIIADDDPDMRELLQHQLDSDKFKVTLKENTEDLLATLNKKPDKFDVVLLDHYYPGGMSGIECLKEIKANIHLRDLPVILQTAEKDSEHVTEALEEGAFYFLEKTTKRKVLRSIIKSAMESSLRYLNIENKRKELANSLQFIDEAHFHIRTLEEMENLTVLLSAIYPDPDNVTIGIHELLTNAIEHGNLGISYDAKTKLVLKNLWHEEIEKRLNMEEHKNKTVHVQLKKSSNEITLLIEDDGQGFKSDEFLSFNQERLFDTHGRGIAVAKSLSFDELDYLGKGNVVQTKVYLKK